MKLYKYSRPSLLKHAFADGEAVFLKFDYPHNYNDPLELFLTLQGDEDDRRVIAYYKEILGEIPQLPTTCFSKRPDIIPMWAHYGEEHSGFAIEFDEMALSKIIPIGYLEDVEYVEKTGITDWELIKYAATTLKPRHTYNIQTDAFKSAYFTKNRCWEYEKERRLVIGNENFEAGKTPMLLKFPADCVTAIISGVRTSDKLRANLAKVAKQFHCPHYKMKIGRSSCIPYFIDGAENSFLFVDSQLTKADYVCEQCSEPLKKNNTGLCQWCMIDDNDEAEAHMNNPFTLIDHLGIREEFHYGFTMRGIKPIGNLMKGGSKSQD